MSSLEVIANAAPPDASGLEAFLSIDQAVLEAIPAAVYVCSADGLVVRFNRRATELWGRTPRPGSDERFGCAFRLYEIDGRPLPHAEAPMEAVLRTGLPERNREIVIERPDGSRIIALVNVEPLKGPSGRVQGAVNCFQDITARKRSEDQARANEHRHRQVLDALPAAIYTTDADGRITFFNREVANLAGREPELGKDQWCVTWKLYRADGTPLPQDQYPMAVALKEKRPVRGVTALAERPDGTRVPVQPHPTPLFDQNGIMIGALNMLVDISDRQHASDAQQRLIAIVESSDDAIISKDLNGIINSWNKGAERLFGYSTEEIVGKSVLTLIPQHLHNEEPRILERIRNGDRIDHYETVRLRKDGSPIDISLTISPVKGTDGTVVGASKIARDITERKRAQQILARHVDEQAALYELTDRLHRAESLADIYDSSLDAIVRAMRCDRASILLFDDTNTMRFVAWRNLSEKYRAAVEGHTPWSVDERHPLPISIDNIETADLPDELKTTVRSEQIAALAFIPLVSSGKLIGKFMTYYGAPHAFAPADIDLAFIIARQLCFSLERRRAADARRAVEESLRESERRLELALSAGQMGAWEWNIDTGEVIWSPVLEKIHGMEPGTFKGRFEEFEAFIHPDDLDMVLAQLRASAKTGAAYHAVYRVDRPDGTPRWLEAFGRTVAGVDGKPHKLAGVCMDITERKQAESQRDLMVAELSHRVKNTLATVISIARQSFSKGPSIEEARRSFDGRILALAQTHGRLAEENWSGVPFEVMLLDEFAPYRSGSNIKVSGPNLTLNPKCAVVLGMAFHELTTNAAKYGALSTKAGVVDVSWEVQPDRRLVIHWVESGGPAVKPPSRSGFGRLLLERALASDLRGEVKMGFTPGGLTCEIMVPLDGHDAYVNRGVPAMTPTQQ